MKKEMKIALGILGILLLFAILFMMLNSKDVKAKKLAQDELGFRVIAKEKQYKLSIKELEEIGKKDILANYKPNGKKPIERTYQGVYFSEIMNYLQIDTSSYESVVFTALDGYASAISIDEALADGKCAIVWQLEGESLGTKEESGQGPYLMILPKDQFSQRWCKFLMEVSLE